MANLPTPPCGKAHPAGRLPPAAVPAGVAFGLGLPLLHPESGPLGASKGKLF